jgi:hypothetical protein
MVRCVNCGHLNDWVWQPVVACGNCSQVVIMPDMATAQTMGVFNGVKPNFWWELREDEAIIFLDAMQGMMESIQERLKDETTQAQYTALIGTYTFCKMTRTKFRNKVPDLQDQVEA